MSTRKITHILKHSDVSNKLLPTSLYIGEPIINTADGIMFFSGSSQSGTGWVSASTPTFFEVGSNLYDLQIRNKITKYQNQTNLSGKFLSGTTNGFVLADLTAIGGVDSYVTGFTYSNNNFTIKQNNGVGDFTTNFNTMTGLTVNGTLTSNIVSASTVSATTLNLGTIASYNGGTNVSGKFLSGTTNGFVLNDVSAIAGIDTYLTAVTYSNNILTFKLNQGKPDIPSPAINTMTGLTVNGILSATTGNLTTLNATGGTITTLGSTTANLGTANVTTLNATGGTITSLTSTTLNLGTIASYSGITNVSGKFLSGTTNGFVLGSISAITGVDTYVTGFTYSPTTNTISLEQNQGVVPKTVTISTVSGLTVTDLSNDRLVYTTTAGKLTTTSNATFNGTNMVLPPSGSLIIGTGGVTIGSGGSAGTAGTGDLTVHGSLTVFGGSISAFTSQLYVEDDNLTLNYNPTGSTIATSIGAGLTIQDGNGIASGNVTFDVRAMNGFTGLTAQQVPVITEYSGPTGFANRAFVTQLNDIVIRSTNTTTPNGVRVLGEFDILDGGTY